MQKDRLQQIIDKIIQFDKDRDWGSGTPSSLTKSIIIEAAELLEHFQWDDSSSKSLEEKLKEKNWEKVEHEVVDILWYLLKFCHYYNIDIYEAFNKKYEHNSKKFPIEVKGDRNQFYTEQHNRYREMKK